MFTKQESILIQASPETVFRYVSDLKRHPEWADQKMEMDVQGDPVQTGTTFIAATYYMGKETCKGKVVEMAGPSLFAYECDTSSSGRAIWTMTLTPEAGGTRLTHKYERLDAPGWFKVVQPLMFPLIGKKMVAKGLANIKRNVEAGVPATG